MSYLSLPETPDEYKKSNFLVSAKYRSNLLENQILAISLANADSFYEDNTDGIKGVLVSDLKASYIMKTLGKKGGSFYQDLNDVAKSMTSRVMGMMNPDKKVFDYLSVIIRAKYENGIFTIYYNPFLKNNLVDIKKNFTMLSLKIMSSFKHTFSFRMYELLKSQCYFVNRNQHCDEEQYIISFSLSELKLNLGVVNSDSDKVRKILQDKKNPNYDKAVEIAPEKSYKDWGNFKKYVLDLSINEINGQNEDGSYKNNMHISYKALKSGRGGKVMGIIFTVTLFGQNKRQPEPISKDDCLDYAYELFDGQIKMKDIRSIAEAADYDIQRIDKAYRASRGQEIDNLTAWIISAIRNNYEPTSPTVTGTKKESRDRFKNFEERDYDFEEIERMFVKNL